jgi:hypothetical protein
MFPKIPADLTALSQDELKALRAEIKTKASELTAAGTVDPADAAAVTEFVEGSKRVKAEVARRNAEQAAFEQTAADLADLADDEDEPVVEASDAPDDDDEGGEDEGDEEGADDAADEQVLVTASHLAPAKVPTRKRPSTFGLTGDQPQTAVAQAAAQAAAAAPVARADTILRAGGNGTDAFEDWSDLAETLTQVANVITPQSNRQTVGIIPGTFDADHTFLEDPIANVGIINNMRSLAQSTDPELQAAFCAPATPSYVIGCRNTDRRPVFNSMPVYASPRNAVSIYPSPTLEDITTGIGIWDRDDDADDEAVKAACQTIDCADSETYYIYGVYRCLTVKNLLQMSFPELVEAYLNRLAAAQARLAENQLLNAMGARATAITAPPQAYDGPTALLTTILVTLALHQESQRWDVEGNMHAWIPRWVRTAIKASLARRRRTDGGGVRMATDAEVNQIFTNAGVNVTWFIDRPTWAATIPAVQVASSLQNFPTTVDILVAPEGKFAVMDRGTLSIGVAPGNLYRDNVSNSRNEFTLFFESFEGLVDTDSCPAYLLEIPVCWNGRQIADVAAPDCDGSLAST